MKNIIWICLVLTPLSAIAVESFVSVGVGRGGTNLSDLTGGQNYKINAGSGIFMIGGVILPVSPTTPHGFEAQLGLGYMFDDDARNDDRAVSWSRIPIEAIYFYRNTQEMFRVGWGPIYHFASLKGKGSNATATSTVDNSLGWAIAIEKIYGDGDGDSNHFGVGLRYNFIKYHSSKFTHNADGNGLFLTLSGYQF